MSKEITLHIQVAREECNDLKSFLEAKGIRATKSFGVFNSASGSPDPEKLKELAKPGTPYLLVTGAVGLMIGLFNSWAKARQKRLTIIRYRKGGIKVEIKNFGVSHIKQLKEEVFDVLNMSEPIPKKHRAIIEFRINNGYIL